MIEAVNSVISNSSYTKAVVEQQSVAQSFAANPDRVQVVPQAPYISPYVRMDINYDRAVLQLRDSATGDVVRQIPTEGQLEAYKRAQAAQQARRDSAPKVQSSTVETSATSSTSGTTTSAPTQAPSAPLPQIVSSDTSFAPKAGSISVDTQA